MTEVILLSLYVLCLSCILVYCLLEATLAFQYIKAKKQANPFLPDLAEETTTASFPVVTIQLPVFNELYVVERLIDTVVQFDYPKDKLEIQVLDDSTDETLEISRNKVLEYQSKGFDITLLHRTDRTGFKAGALQAGMKQAKGEFIAIFDADFVPKKDFLQKTLPYFADPKIGVVQTKWEHINKDYSVLTKIQALFLDVHFSIEQLGRNSAGYFINFNGTAGIWRKTTIESAGGWKADTLTEDLDLSYRAQLKGWKFKYLEGITSPAELPADMRAFKSQQFRWIKGGAETARKILPDIVKADLPFSTKVHAFTHLLSSSVYIIVFLTAFISVPLLFVKNQYIQYEYDNFGAIFLLNTIALGFVYATSVKHLKNRPTWKTFCWLLPAFLSITLGLSLHNALAAFRGLIGEKTPFIRTPKFNLANVGDAWQDKKYVSREIDFLTIVEGFFALYFLSAIIFAFVTGSFVLLAFHLIAFFGFSATFIYSISHAKVIGK